MTDRDQLGDHDRLDALRRHLRQMGPGAIAVSGGVDSLTLAVVAHRLHPERTEIFHALSPAVPPEATERVSGYASREDWTLRLVDAGEFGDDDYLRNPVQRCYFCKRHLYDSIASHTRLPIMSGTNLDDLDDFRPGLRAAADHRVLHPYVEAGIGKTSVRRLAASLGLVDIAELPAQPCLSSRVETGIRIDPDSLRRVNRIERELTAALGSPVIRCRVRHDGIAIELDGAVLRSLTDTDRTGIRQRVTAAWPGQSVVITEYRRGSAFLGPPVKTSVQEAAITSGDRAPAAGGPRVTATRPVTHVEQP